MGLRIGVVWGNIVFAEEGRKGFVKTPEDFKDHRDLVAENSVSARCGYFELKEQKLAGIPKGDQRKA